MIHEYRETKLNNAATALGDAFDYAVNVCGIAGDDFAKLFVVSSTSKQMENADSAVVLGKSGIEIAIDVVRETKGTDIDAAPKESFARTKEYWIGWAVCHYQQYSDRSYAQIFDALSYNELDELYYTLHETDISKFMELADRRMKERYPDTNLKRLRTSCSLTQAELARRSGIGLRAIQVYEQRRKNINKASADTLYRLAKVFGCTMEDLVEKDTMKPADHGA